jgi:CRP-like cAMP-binding protein
LLKFMVERLQQTASRMYEHAALSAVGRVHAELLRQARESEDLTIRPSPILSDIALRVSTTRETASRAVNALERRGIIRRNGEALVIVAPHRLEELIL